MDNESCEAFYSNKKTGNLKVFKISFYPSIRISVNTTYLKIDWGCQDGSVSIICRANWTVLSSSFRTHRKVKGRELSPQKYSPKTQETTTVLSSGELENLEKIQ